MLRAACGMELLDPSKMYRNTSAWSSLRTSEAAKGKLIWSSSLEGLRLAAALMALEGKCTQGGGAEKKKRWCGVKLYNTGR
jgi:hypothetical protein